MTAFISFGLFNIFLVLVGTGSLWSVTSQYPFVLTYRREFSGNRSKEEEGSSGPACGWWWVASSVKSSHYPFVLTYRREFSGNRSKEEEGSSGPYLRLVVSIVNCLVSTPLSLLTDENSAVTKAKRRKDFPGLPSCGWWWLVSSVNCRKGERELCFTDQEDWGLKLEASCKISKCIS
jgi:hypothetical protein